MVFKSIVGLLMLLIGCSGNQQPPKDGQHTMQLRIDNGINRGTGYTDASGADYNLRYIPITITNDSTISIHLQIAFEKEYHYGHLDRKERVKLIPLPTEWALDGMGVTERMMDALPGYIEDPVFNATIEPGEQYVLGIGTLYPNPPNSTGILPRTLFTHDKSGMFPACDWLMNKDPSSQPQIALGLKLVFGGNCMIVPCGQVSYPEQ